MSKDGPPVAKCRLCLGPGPLTDEDVTPTWTRKHLIAKYVKSPVSQMPARHKFRICRQCNARLGEVFESPSAALLKQLIDAQPLDLHPAEQRLVGGWTTKTVLLTCLGDSKPEGWGHDLARKLIVEMMSSGMPPINTSVRLARMEMGDHSDSVPGNYAGNLLPVTRMPQFAFFGINIIGNLCFEVVTGIPNLDRYVRWIDKRSLRFIRVWPTAVTSVSWPPPKKLHMTQVVQMREAFMGARNTAVELADPRLRSWDIDSD